MMTALKSISLFLLSLTLCSGLSFASDIVKDNEEGVKQRERREKSYKIKAKRQEKASLAQDVKDDMETYLEKYYEDSEIDDEQPSKKKLIPSVKVTPSKKKRVRSTVIPKNTITHSSIAKDDKAPAKKFLPVPRTPKKELKATRSVPMAPFKIGSLLHDCWLQMERKNPKLYEVIGNTPFSKGQQ